jgi:hypothetical protein
MKRVFYIALGATVGVLVVRRVTAAAESLQPDNVARRIAGGVQGFFEDVRAGMSEREVELRAALGVGDAADSPDAA